MGSRIKLLEGAVLGAAAAYVFDPDRGRARRARLRDELAASARRLERRTSHRARDVSNRTKGRVARRSGRGVFHPTDDRAIAQNLRGVLARLDFPTPHLTTEVVNGVVRIRGEIASPRNSG